MSSKPTRFRLCLQLRSLLFISPVPTTGEILFGWTPFARLLPNTPFIQKCKKELTGPRTSFDSFFYIDLPEELTKVSGFLFLGLKTEEAVESVFENYVSVVELRDRLPVHAMIQKKKENIQLSFSTWIETIIDNFVDNEVQVDLIGAICQPRPTTTIEYMLALSDLDLESTLEYLSPICIGSEVERLPCPERFTFLGFPSFVPGKDFPSASFRSSKTLLSRMIGVRVYLLGFDYDQMKIISVFPNVVLTKSDEISESLAQISYKNDGEEIQLETFLSKSVKAIPHFDKLNFRAVIKVSQLLSKQPLVSNPSIDHRPPQAYREILAQQGNLKASIENARSDSGSLKKILDSKNQTLEILTRDLNNTTAAVKLSACEILNIRKDISNLEQNNDDLQRRLRTIAQVEAPIDPSRIPDHALKSEVFKLSRGYQNERIKGEKLTKQLKEIKTELSQKFVLNEKLTKVKAEVSALETNIMLLRTSSERAKSAKEKILRNENLILRLEKINRETQLSEKKRIDFAKCEETLRMNSQLKLEVEQTMQSKHIEEQRGLLDERQSLVAEIQELRATLASNEPFEEKDEIEKLETDVFLWRNRVATLEKQLLNNAIEHSKRSGMLPRINSVSNFKNYARTS